MNKILLLFSLMIGSTIACKAQEGYQISGKVDGIADGKILLVSEESGKLDTLATTLINNGVFIFTGKVNQPLAAYLMLENGSGVVPLILENVNFMVNISSTGALIQGGKQQEIFNLFSRNNMKLLQTQNRIQQEFQQAEQTGNKNRMQTLRKQFEEAVINARQEEEQLLKQYADSYVAAYVVAVGARQFELKTLKIRYGLLGDSAKATIPGRFVAELIADMEQFEEGYVVPDFTVTTQVGDSLSLYPVKGKLKLVVFWESTDSLCREENVNLLDIYQKYHLRGLEIISISRDQNVQVWEKAIHMDGMFWKQGIDRNSVVFNRYHVKTVPFSILLDGENKIIAKDLKGTELQKRIGELLKRK